MNRRDRKNEFYSRPSCLVLIVTEPRVVRSESWDSRSRSPSSFGRKDRTSIRAPFDRTCGLVRPSVGSPSPPAPPDRRKRASGGEPQRRGFAADRRLLPPARRSIERPVGDCLKKAGSRRAPRRGTNWLAVS